MAKITFKGEPFNTLGSLPAKCLQAPDFTLTGSDLEDYPKSSFKKKNIVLNIFPSLDTSVCAATVRKFNEEAASLKDTVVLCVSMDLPFAHQRFCEAEGISDVSTMSAFRHPEFGKDYGVVITDGPLAGLFSRAVVVISSADEVIHAQQVPEIAEEPDYKSALEVLG